MTRAPLPCETGAECLRRLNRLLIRAVKALGGQGQTDLACRIAAEAWSALRKERPEEAAKLNGVQHFLTRPVPEEKESDMPNPQQLDVRDLPPPQRHALIFDTCGKLPVGNAVILVNDHDPRPLYYQFEAEQPGQFGWEYIERGPEVWRVRITRTKTV
ncbi:MAG: DUF2249 domain-containing protein [Stellaceae bacterium]